MNSDIPQEWFEVINNKLKYGRIQDLKINEDILNVVPNPRDYISSMAYARIFAPEMIDVDRLLYLDTDVIVDGNLDRVLYYDLEGFSLGAVLDLDGLGFNSGVLLFEAQQLREKNFTKNIWDSVKDRDYSYGDQSLLNEYFKNMYKKLPLEFNYLIGSDWFLFYDKEAFSNSESIVDKMDKVEKPIIYHYITEYKPWKLTSSVRKRDLWWKYYSLDWDELDKSVKFKEFKKKIFIFTSLAELRDIELLVKEFPNIEFNIAAYVDMIFTLKRLLQYSNVKLYPMIIGKNIDKLINECDLMLDITDGPDYDITKKFSKTGKPIVGYREDKFKSVISENDYVLVHSTEEMISKLKNL